ncbi:hypothetical protein FACS189491_08100 [Spirochaetia bacterium]|nr:hypothetical protein FACS189491_08100 [Spirochaetia bacterium]
MLTDLGKMLRNLCTDNEITQEQLAKDLGVSPATLSNILTGKAAPGMELLAGAITRFNLKGKDMRELVFRAFSSSFHVGQKIEIDPRFFKEERLDTLAQAIVTLLLHPDFDALKEKTHGFSTLKKSMNSWFDTLDYIELSVSLTKVGVFPQSDT